MLYKRFIDGLQSCWKLLAPASERCAVCSDQKSSGSILPLCRKCFGQIPWITPELVQCQVCGRSECCMDCGRRKQTWFEYNMSAVRYSVEMKKWLGAFKYRGDERLQQLFNGMLVSLFHRFLLRQSWKPRDISLLTYVPLSRERLEERGFNQTELFAQGIGEQFRLPIVSLLERIRHTDKQSYKSRSERIADLQGVFAADWNRIESLVIRTNTKSLNIVLLDDVFTTGSTLNECSRVIKEALPGARVYGLTWAR